MTGQQGLLRTMPTCWTSKDKLGLSYLKTNKDFLLSHGGHETQIGEEYVKLWDKDDLLLLNQDYKILENLPGTIGIGDNGAGEFIGIEKPNDGLRVVLIPFIDLDKRYHIEIGKSFTDFLLRLDQGENGLRTLKKIREARAAADEMYKPWR